MTVRFVVFPRTLRRSWADAPRPRDEVSSAVSRLRSLRPLANRLDVTLSELPADDHLVAWLEGAIDRFDPVAASDEADRLVRELAELFQFVPLALPDPLPPAARWVRLSLGDPLCFDRGEYDRVLGQLKRQAEFVGFRYDEVRDSPARDNRRFRLSLTPADGRSEVVPIPPPGRDRDLLAGLVAWAFAYGLRPTLFPASVDG